MMMKKLLIGAGLVSAMLVATAPARGAAYFIAGQWYFFSMNFDATVGKVTGNDIKLNTYIGADIGISAANVLCGNPKSKAINPGNGPGLQVNGKSTSLTQDDFVKADRQRGNIYDKLTTVQDIVAPQFRLAPEDLKVVIDGVEVPIVLCKDAAGDPSEWRPLFWQDKNCYKNEEGWKNEDPKLYSCYKEFADFDGGVLKFVTGPLKGQPVARKERGEVCEKAPDPSTDPGSYTTCPWTFVYLPTAFTYDVFLSNETGEIYGNRTGTCTFPANNERGAKKRGEPYSLDNPPVKGWANQPIDYVCNPPIQ